MNQTESIGYIEPIYIEQLKEATREFQAIMERLEREDRNDWVQQIKLNYRRNKRKRMRCRKKLK